MDIWKEFVNEGIITDADIIKYYYLNCYQWSSPQKELLDKYKSNDNISMLVKCNLLDENFVKEAVTARINHYLINDKNFTDNILKQLSHDIIRQNLNSQLDKEIPLLASNNKYRGYSTFKGDVLVKFDERDLLDGKYLIPDGVTAIGDYAFIRCYELKSIVIPSSVKQIGCCAFAICKNLEEIKLPNSITSIDTACFFACINLTELKLPSRLTNIPSLLCCNCKKLATVKLCKGVKNIAPDAFMLCDQLQDINIPKHLQYDWDAGKFKSISPNSTKTVKNILKY